MRLSKLLSDLSLAGIITWVLVFGAVLFALLVMTGKITIGGLHD